VTSTSTLAFLVTCGLDAALILGCDPGAARCRAAMGQAKDDYACDSVRGCLVQGTGYTVNACGIRVEYACRPRAPVGAGLGYECTKGAQMASPSGGLTGPP